MSNAVLDPYTRENITTVIVKDNLNVGYNFLDNMALQDSIVVKCYYVTTFNNQNIKLHCVDKKYTIGMTMEIIPKKIYDVLNVTKKLNKCLLIHDISYDVMEYDDKGKETGIEHKSIRFNFKIVNEREYNAYAELDRKARIAMEEANGIIRRPKKVEN